MKDEQLLQEWRKYTTGANIHDMGVMEGIYIYWIEHPEKGNHGVYLERCMRIHLAKTKLAELNQESMPIFKWQDYVGPGFVHLLPEEKCLNS